MAIIIGSDKKVIVQGITGREGQVRTKLMKDYGTNLVGGSTPGNGGREVQGLPVFDTVRELTEQIGEIDISVIFVPAHLVKGAALEAIDSGIKFLVIVPDRVPVHDVMAISAAAKKTGAKFLGPNTLGTLSPDVGVLGMMGGSAAAARSFFKKGRIGVTSRSGGISSSMAYYLGREGIGASSIVHVGGDPLVGLPHPEVVKLYQEDPETDAIVMFGEIGTSQEEQVAEMIDSGEVTKPLFAYIGGKQAKEGTRFSHAGAIVEGNRGTWKGKVEALRGAGATVVESFEELPQAVKEGLGL